MFTTPRLLQRQQQAYKLRDAISDLPHLHSTSPLGRFPSVYRHPVWYGKTRMAWLPDGEKISKISLFVLHNARTWQTHTQTPHDGIGRAYASHRASKIMVIVNSYRMVNSLNRWFYLLVRHVNTLFIIPPLKSCTFYLAEDWRLLRRVLFEQSGIWPLCILYIEHLSQQRFVISHGVNMVAVLPRDAC